MDLLPRNRSLTPSPRPRVRPPDRSTSRMTCSEESASCGGTTRRDSGFETQPQSPISNPKGRDALQRSHAVRLSDEDLEANGNTTKPSASLNEQELSTLKDYGPGQPLPPLSVAEQDAVAPQGRGEDWVRRNLSLVKGLYALRRSSTSNSTAAPAGSCGPPSSHTPVPSQSIAPAKSSVLKELTDFFSSRARKGKLALPSRIERKVAGSGSSTPSRTGSDRTCSKCGVDMTDWWVRRDLEALIQEQIDQGLNRVCASCKAVESSPETMPGSWK
jgi:hypothetical protein